MSCLKSVYLLWRYKEPAPPAVLLLAPPKTFILPLNVRLSNAIEIRPPPPPPLSKNNPLPPEALITPFPLKTLDRIQILPPLPPPEDLLRASSPFASTKPSIVTDWLVASLMTPPPTANMLPLPCERGRKREPYELPGDDPESPRPPRPP